MVEGYDGVRSGDAALHFNFRPDRARELTRALALADFDAFPRQSGAPLAGRYACMTTYDGSFGLPIAFPKETYPNIFPEVIARAGLTQFRCAETEKYAHVTYFFNGGREAPFEGEDRKMLPSPKDVATYDLKPEMSAAAVAQTSRRPSPVEGTISCSSISPTRTWSGTPVCSMLQSTPSRRSTLGVGAIVEADARQGGRRVLHDGGPRKLRADEGPDRRATAHRSHPQPRTARSM